jgi:hypothetical protein
MHVLIGSLLLPDAARHFSLQLYSIVSGVRYYLKMSATDTASEVEMSPPKKREKRTYVGSAEKKIILNVYKNLILTRRFLKLCVMLLCALEFVNALYIES